MARAAVTAVPTVRVLTAAQSRHLLLGTPITPPAGITGASCRNASYGAINIVSKAAPSGGSRGAKKPACHQSLAAHEESGDGGISLALKMRGV